MKFSCILGNPPYGDRSKKGSSAFLHLQIMKTALDFCIDKLCFIMPSKPITSQLDKKGIWYNMFKNAVCTDVTTVKKGTFPNTNMDDTAIYYCDRKASPNDYDKQLDVDKKIYNAIDAEGHRLFIDKMNKMSSITPAFTMDNWNEKKVKRNTKDGKWYLNVSRANGDFGAQWFSGVLVKEDVKTRDEEIKFCEVHNKTKNIIECPTKEYGENLKSLMINGLVLRYSLWLTQTNQHILPGQFKYVPDVDYTIIDTDEKLLKVCGFTSDEIVQVMKYLNDFDFSQHRNELVRGIKEEPDSPSSGSEPSKPVII